MIAFSTVILLILFLAVYYGVASLIFDLDTKTGITNACLGLLLIAAVYFLFFFGWRMVPRSDSGVDLDEQALHLA